MRPRDRAEDGDQDDEIAPVGSVLARSASAVLGQPIRHDAGADDGGDQQRGAERLGGDAPVRCFDHAARSTAVGPSRADVVQPVCQASLSCPAAG